jgi:hypothetical protein
VRYQFLFVCIVAFICATAAFCNTTKDLPATDPSIDIEVPTAVAADLSFSTLTADVTSSPLESRRRPHHNHRPGDGCDPVTVASPEPSYGWLALMIGAAILWRARRVTPRLAASNG